MYRIHVAHEDPQAVGQPNALRWALVLGSFHCGPMARSARSVAGARFVWGCDSLRPSRSQCLDELTDGGHVKVVDDVVGDVEVSLSPGCLWSENELGPLKDLIKPIDPLTLDPQGCACP